FPAQASPGRRDRFAQRPLNLCRMQASACSRDKRFQRSVSAIRQRQAEGLEGRLAFGVGCICLRTLFRRDRAGDSFRNGLRCIRRRQASLEGVRADENPRDTILTSLSDVSHVTLQKALAQVTRGIWQSKIETLKSKRP